MARFGMVADAASRNFFVEVQYKMRMRLSLFQGLQVVSTCAGNWPWNSATSISSQRLARLRARNKNRFGNRGRRTPVLPERMSNIADRIGGTSAG
jgi:hypothetical protein